MKKDHNQILCGDCADVLRKLPSDSVDLVLTSPPYFQQRDYAGGNCIGNEKTVDVYVDNVDSVFGECVRVCFAVLRRDRRFPRRCPKFQDELLNRVAKNTPVPVMARGMIENILSPAKLDDIFQHHVRTQRQRTILFSFLVELMLLVPNH